MNVPVLFLVVVAVGLLFTLNALRPLPFEPTSFAAFLDVHRHRPRLSGCPVLVYVRGVGWVLEVFRSLRTVRVVDAIARFLAVVYADAARAGRPSP